MGRHSNLILVDGNGRILEAARHVDHEMSRVRQIQPGAIYEAPPAQDKLPPEQVTMESLRQRLAAQGDMPLQKALMNSVMGLSPQASRELAFRVLDPGTDRTSDIEDTAARLAEFLQRLPGMADPRVLLDDAGDPKDVMPFPYLGQAVDHQRACRSMSEALESYFGGRDAKDRIDQKSASMVRLLKGHIERCEKKLALQEEELASAERMEEYRVSGELILANVWQLHKGMSAVEVDDFYSEEGGKRTIALDVQLTPQQNAQRYFKKYQKARSARQTAAEQKEKTLTELAFLEGTLLDVGKCVGESELE